MDQTCKQKHDHPEVVCAINNQILTIFHAEMGRVDTLIKNDATKTHKQTKLGGKFKLVQTVHFSC